MLYRIDDMWYQIGRAGSGFVKGLQAGGNTCGITFLTK